jgi:protein SCO1/2
MAKTVATILLLLAGATKMSGSQDHTGHQVNLARDGLERSLAEYEVPDVTLIDPEGRRVALRELIDTARPVMLEFIFATCTTICPVMSAGFSHLQGTLGEESERVSLISITIDPEHDSPEIMRAYLRRYKAKPGWSFLTGSRADIDSVLTAFDAYVSNKMLHEPVTLLRRPASREWLRINGLLSGKELMEEYRMLIAEPSETH